jgi:sugar-specific transcriptional regulator TrmB
MQHENKAEVLTRLGLTSNQARIYLNLTRLPASSAAQIAKISNVAREEVYRTMPRLQELSLVEIMVNTPALYRATPLKQGISTLLNRRKEENIRLLEDAGAILKDTVDSANEAGVQKEPKFVLLPKREMNIARRNQAILNTKESLDSLTTYPRLRQLFTGTPVIGSIRKSLKKGAKMRTIIQEPQNHNQLLELIKPLMQPTYEVKYSANHPPVLVAICDNQNVFISTQSGVDIRNETCFWTDNSCIVKLAAVYFENMWKDAYERTDNAEP